MGRKQFTQLPAAPAHYELYDPATAQKQKDKAFKAAERCHDQHTSFLPVLQTGSQVTLHDPHTGLWNQEGIVTEVREDKLSYIVQVGNRLFVRSRKMLKLANSEPVNITQENDRILQSLPTATAANTSSTLLTNRINQPILPQPINLLNNRIDQPTFPQPISLTNRINQPILPQPTNLNLQPHLSKWETGFLPNPRSRQRRPSRRQETLQSSSTG